MTAPSGETVVEAENYTNLEMRKIQDWAQNNKLKFNENKSKVMLMSRRERREKDIEIYVKNKKTSKSNQYNIGTKCNSLTQQADCYT